MYFQHYDGYGIKECGEAEPFFVFSDQPMRSENNNELAHEPMAPNVFRAADSVPEHGPRTSQQTVQLELRVRSPPKVVKAKQATKDPAEGMKGDANSVAVANPKRNIGRQRARQVPVASFVDPIILSTAIPPLHVANAPQSSGMLEYRPAAVVVIA
jgi:hypothetical protein